MSVNEYDFDQIVIGSGFGGSVSALRLSEKGYRVLVLEQGLRRNDEDFPTSNWDTKKALWMPCLGNKGTIQVSYTSKVTVLCGIGVGGGSQIYANVHFVPDEEVFSSPSWSRIRSDWHHILKPYYALAQRMLGTTVSPFENIADVTFKEIARDIGREDTYQTVSTGVLFPENDGVRGKRVVDPYFDGDGPDRHTCQYCAGCTMGCRHNAKNTLMKNYLYFAERNGVEIWPECTVTMITPIIENGIGQDGSLGYKVTFIDRRGGTKHKTTLRAKGVVVSAGVMGSVPLLLKMRDKYRALPNISKWLGQQIRTNSETLTSSCNMDVTVDEGLAITSFMSADDTTNIEINRFNEGADANWFYTPYVPMVSGTGLARILKFIGNTILHPIKTARMLWPVGKAKSSIIFLVMQSSEAFIHFEWRRRWYRFFRKAITAIQKPEDDKLTVSFPAAEKVTRQYAEKLGGEPGSSLTEILFGTPMTAHIMSGVAIGTDANNGVVDESGEVFGYQNLRVLDGSIIPGNLGVNPSLTITALSEYAMSKVPVCDTERAATIKPIHFSQPLNGAVSNLNSDDAQKLLNS